MNSQFFLKAFWVEELNGDTYISLDIHCGEEDEWEYLYNKVKDGCYLPRDQEGNGYFFENPESDWFEVSELKPTGKYINVQEEKETILKCLELKVYEQLREIEEARKKWTDHK